MSDTPTRTGIGGIAALPEDDHPAPSEHAIRLAEAARVFPDPQAQFEDFMAEVRGTLDALRSATVGTGDRIETLERAVAQLQGQMGQIELALPQHVHAIQTFDARLNAMAQQIARNVRLAVLDAAVKARGVGDPSSIVMKLAREFLEFAEGPSGGATPATIDTAREPGTLAH